MTSGWAKTNKVGNQQVTCELWDQESLKILLRSPPLLPAGGFLALVESESQRKSQMIQMTEPFSLTLLWMSMSNLTLGLG